MTLLHFFHDTRRSIGEHFSYAAHNLCGIVTEAYDGVCAELRSMLDHDLECVAPCLLAQIRIEGDIAAEEDLETSSDISDQRSRANDDAPNDAEIFCDLVSVKLEICCDE